MPHKGPDGAFPERLRDKPVSIEPRAGQGDKEVAAPDRPRIRPHAPNRRSRRALGERAAGECGYVSACEEGHRAIRC